MFLDSCLKYVFRFPLEIRFQIPASNMFSDSRYCRHDSLTVYRNASYDPLTQVAWPLCGQRQPQAISGLGSLYVRFWTDSSVTGRGFHALYR